MSTLVVTRKIGEAVRIGTDITVRLARAGRDGAFRFVIEAPRSVPVVREELLERRDANAARIHGGRDRECSGR